MKPQIIEKERGVYQDETRQKGTDPLSHPK